MYTFDEKYFETLFAQAERFLDDNPYLSAVEQEQFHTKVVGVSYDGRQELVSCLAPDTPVYLERDPSNHYDPNAIKVVTVQGNHLGFLNRKLALVMAPLIDTGEHYHAYITTITGGTDGRNFGINLLIVKDGGAQEDFDAGIRDKLSRLPNAALMAEVKKAILGEYDFHAKQREAIDALFVHENVLAVFGTGRGKSAIFQTVAAVKALSENMATIIVYPLRALANDQYLSMQRMFASLGLRVFRANGSLGIEERAAFFTAVSQGDVDLILTTPEFLLHHASKLGPIVERLGLFVVDESHHLTDTHRPAYRNLDRVVELLGNPQVLAVTATADDSTAKNIASMLNINRIIIDDYVRSNLALVDLRGIKGKEGYVLDVAGKSDKSIIYVGTRKETVRLAKAIQEKVPSLMYRIGFYHGGMTSKDRATVEEAFRTGYLKCMVATSAFGEGVNVPDISDVILYQMMYSLTEFNQQSGRAGRGGQEARIHLLFGMPDGIINLNIVQNQAPTREQVAYVYQATKALPANTTNKELAEKVKEIGGRGTKANETLMSVSLGILEELGLIQREVMQGKRTITVIPNPQKTDLALSLRFKEGREELEEFLRFREDILNMSEDDLLGFVQRPIRPRTDVLRPVVERKINWL